jgi:hypothetical protein
LWCRQLCSAIQDCDFEDPSNISFSAQIGTVNQGGYKSSHPGDAGILVYTCWLLQELKVHKSLLSNYMYATELHTVPDDMGYEFACLWRERKLTS